MPLIDEIHESADRRHLLRIISADRELIDRLVSQRIAEWSTQTVTLYLSSKFTSTENFWKEYQ